MQNQTLTDLVKLMERGLIVIPKSIRDKAGLEKGVYVRVTLRGDEIMLKPLSSEDVSFSKSGVRIEKTKYDKQAGMKILSQNSKSLWSEKDDAFLTKGRKQIETKLKKNDQP